MEGGALLGNPLTTLIGVLPTRFLGLAPTYSLFEQTLSRLYACHSASKNQAPTSGLDCIPLNALCRRSASVPAPLTMMHGWLWSCTCHLHVLLRASPGAGCSRGCMWCGVGGKGPPAAGPQAPG